MPRIHAQNLSFGFQDRLVIDDIEFDWSKNRIGILGRNGSGKSTLARLIAGLIAPRSGQIAINEMDIYKDREAALALVGIVFQNPDQQIIFPTVIEEMKFGLSQLGQKNAEENALKALQKYGRADWKNRQIANLSQGQRHFLALISILEMHPQVLILDEPFTGLDIPTVMRLQNTLAHYEGMIIHITHEPELVKNYDQIIWLEGGRIKSDGSVEKVLPEYENYMRKLGESDAYTGF